MAAEKHHCFVFVTLVTRQLTVFSHNKHVANASLWFISAGSQLSSWVICTSWEVQLGTMVFSRTTHHSPGIRLSWEQRQNPQGTWTPHGPGPRSRPFQEVVCFWEWTLDQTSKDWLCPTLSHMILDKSFNGLGLRFLTCEKRVLK